MRLAEHVKGAKDAAAAAAAARHWRAVGLARNLLALDDAMEAVAGGDDLGTWIREKIAEESEASVRRVI
jgi:hypothetical protein